MIMKKLRVLIADDHALMRMGMSALLKTDKSISVIGEASDGREAVEKALALEPDLVIMDLQMPEMSGTEALLEIKRLKPSIKVMVLTTFSISDTINRAIEGGADAALLKSTPNDELLEIIHRTAVGERIISGEIHELLRNDPPVPPLSERQRQLLESAAQGLSNREIAARLDLKPDSIKSYFDNLFNKMGVATRTEAVAIALKKHLLKI